jgi:hypothetical protein
VDDSELRTPGWKFNHYEMKVIASAFIVGSQLFVLILFMTGLYVTDVHQTIRCSSYIVVGIIQQN